MKLTPTQRRALLTAYCADYGLSEDSFAKRTIRAILDAGLVTTKGYDLVITDKGRHALGVHVPPSKRPKRMFTAIRHAVATVCPRQDIEVLRRRQASLPSFTDDGQLDWTGVVAVADVSDTYHAALGDDEDVRWSAAATMVTEMGFPCYCDISFGHAVFWTEDE